MSLQHLAQHMAAHGRNGDSMLMHVTPKEVAGLQNLAQQHGGSLTINPHTGLPEANFLDDIGLGSVNKFLPAIAGFALDSFLPGAGEAAGAMFGLGGAAGTAGIVGGLAGLASGSLKDGIMAGLGAYGGASLASGLGNMGQEANTLAAEQSARAAGLSDAERVASIQAAAKPDIGAGLSAAASAPIDFLKNNKWAIGAAALPALADGLSNSGKGVDAPTGPTRYIRRYERDPRTGALYQVEAVPTDQYGDRSAVTFGGVGAPVKYATGGPVTFGGVSAHTVLADPNDTRSDSQKAYDYMMGKPGAKNPMLFYHEQPSTAVLPPVDLNTRTGGHYVFNEATNSYDWVPDAAASTADSAVPAPQIKPISSSSSSSSAAKEPSAWDNMSDAEKRIFYENNPFQKSITELGQKLFGYTGLGMLQKWIDPTMQARQDFILGKTLSPYTNPALHPDFGDPTIQTPEEAANEAQLMSPEAVAQRAAADAENARLYALQQEQNQRPEAGGPITYGSTSGYTPSGGDPNAGTAWSREAVQAAQNHSESDGGGGGGEAATGGLSKNGRFQKKMAEGGIAALAAGGEAGGQYNLGSYSDGGRLLKGPGNGTSDDIPAVIGHGQPARLADGEFVIPARIVSELGNGSTDAGARQLYAMMDRIQAARRKTVGKSKVAFDAKARNHLPA
jgi:hypothetical protein